MRMTGEEFTRLKLSERIDPNDIHRFQVRVLNVTRGVGLWTFQARLKYDDEYLDLGKVIFDM